MSPLRQSRDQRALYTLVYASGVVRRLAVFTVLLLVPTAAALLSLSAPAYADARAQSPPQPSLVIRNIGILTFAGSDAERGTVVVRGGRIAYVGRDSGTADAPLAQPVGESLHFGDTLLRARSSRPAGPSGECMARGAYLRQPVRT